MNTSNDRLRAMIDTIPALAWSAEPDGSIEFLNQRWLEYAGVSSEQTQNWTWTVTIHPDDLQRCMGDLRSILESAESGEIEVRLRRFDGEYRWFLCRVSPLRDESGKVLKWYGINTDIDDRKRAEDLRASELNFRLIVDSIPGLTSTTTAEGGVEFVNQQILDYTGRTLEELKDWAPLVHPDDLAHVLTSWRHSLETGNPFNIENRLRGADGVYRWFQARGLPRRDAEGRIIRWYMLLSDIDERKRAEEKLKRTEWNLLEAQRLSHSGSWSLDVSTGIVSSSPEMIRVFGAQPGEDYLKPNFWFDRIHPEDRKRVRELFERCVIQKTDYQAEFRILLPDGTIRYEHSIGHPILNEAGDLVEFVGTTIDVTEQAQARIRLEKAFEEIKHLKDRLQDENLALREQIDQVLMFEEIVGSSPALQKVLSSIVKVAPADSTVLIRGETGTGKELIARAIHKRSPRSSKAFVNVNCAAIPTSLIASELFGHEKGAFTGALQRRLGRFELAEGGTIFLDEIGELPMEAQITLLRVLQEREFERVGGNQTIRVNVRVIAATNRDLRTAIASGAFRNDLFYRLNVVPMDIPPLRDRKEDIPILIEYFINRYTRKVGKRIRAVEKKTLELLQSYSWPGNIRELQNVIERSIVVSDSDIFSVDEGWLSPTTTSSLPEVDQASSLATRTADQEKKIIEEALAESQGRVSGPLGAAAQLGMPPSTLESKIRVLKINKYRFKKT